MEIRDIYEKLGGNYEDVMSRLMKEERVAKYLLKFKDKDMMAAIESSLEAKDYETAFREAHNMKGVCANLSIDKLREVSSDLTEALRGGEPTVDITPLLDAVRAEYARTVEIIDMI